MAGNTLEIAETFSISREDQKYHLFAKIQKLILQQTQANGQVCQNWYGVPLDFACGSYSRGS